MLEKFNTQVNINIIIGSLQFDVSLDPGFEEEKLINTSEMHNHPLYEVHIIEAGNGVFLTADAEFNVSSGDFIILGPKVYHSFKCNPELPINKKYFKFNYRTTSCIDDLFPQEQITNIIAILREIKCIKYKGSISSLSLIHDINNELKQKAIGYYSIVKNLLGILIVNIIRSVSTILIKEYNLPKFNDNIINRSCIIDAFFDDFNEHISLNDLANKLGLSTRQTTRFLKNQYNCTFKEKLIKTRIEISKKLLTSTNLSINDIMEKVGYESRKHFTNIFAKETGLTPTQYRTSWKLAHK